MKSYKYWIGLLVLGLGFVIPALVQEGYSDDKDRHGRRGERSRSSEDDKGYRGQKGNRDGAHLDESYRRTQEDEYSYTDERRGRRGRRKDGWEQPKKDGNGRQPKKDRQGEWQQPEKERSEEWRQPEKERSDEWQQPEKENERGKRKGYKRQKKY